MSLSDLAKDPGSSYLLFQPFLLGLEKKVIYGVYSSIYKRSKLFQLEDYSDILTPRKYAQAILSKDIPHLMTMESVETPAFTVFWDLLNGWSNKRKLTTPEKMKMWVYISYFQVPMKGILLVKNWFVDLVEKAHPDEISPLFMDIVTKVPAPYFDTNIGRVLDLIKRNVVWTAIIVKRFRSGSYVYITLLKKKEGNLSSQIRHTIERTGYAKLSGIARLGLYSKSLHALIICLVSNGYATELHKEETIGEIALSFGKSIIHTKIAILRYMNRLAGDEKEESYVKRMKEKVRESKEIKEDKEIRDGVMGCSDLVKAMSDRCPPSPGRGLEVMRDLSFLTDISPYSVFVSVEKIGIWVEEYNVFNGPPKYMERYGSIMENGHNNYYQILKIRSHGILDLFIAITFSGYSEILDPMIGKSEFAIPLTFASDKSIIEITPSMRAIITNIRKLKSIGHHPYEILSLLSHHTLVAPPGSVLDVSGMKDDRMGIVLVQSNPNYSSAFLGKDLKWVSSNSAGQIRMYYFTSSAPIPGLEPADRAFITALSEAEPTYPGVKLVEVDSKHGLYHVVPNERVKTLWVVRVILGHILPSIVGKIVQGEFLRVKKEDEEDIVRELEPSGSKIVLVSGSS